MPSRVFKIVDDDDGMVEWLEDVIADTDFKVGGDEPLYFKVTIELVKEPTTIIEVKAFDQMLRHKGDEDG